MINYDLVMKDIIKENQGFKPSLLLHVCCGPCSSGVIKRLASDFNITLYFYNPNLDSLEEYQRRSKELLSLTAQMPEAANIKTVFEEYHHEEFTDLADHLKEEAEGGKRCMLCFHQRLAKSARYAKENNFDYFTTTLSISPYKNVQALNSIGKRLENEYQVNYLYADFKKGDGYKRSVELSKQYNLYRQDYCGCEYSKKEREDASRNS